MQRIVGLVWVCMLLWAGAAQAAEPTDEEKRADAHRTIFRRFSETADTDTLGLGKDAAAVVDLLLDLKRNVRAIRSRQAPRSKYFMGTPHGITEVKDGVLQCRADFVQFTIDEASMPVTRIPAVLEIALEPKRFGAAKAAGEDAAMFEQARRMLVISLAGLAGEHAAESEVWTSLRPRIAALCLETARGDAGHDLYAVLECLVETGDDEIAKILLRDLDAITASKPAYQRGMFVRTICRMPGPTGRTYLLENLDAEDPALVGAALSAVSKDADAEVQARVLAFLTAGSTPAVERNVLSALERIASDEARAAVAEAFGEAEDADRKYALACALTRMGSDEAVSWLEALLAELEKADDRSSQMKRSFLRSLLEKRAD